MYVPKLPLKENDHYSAILVLAHEWVHLSDRKRFGLLFDIGYLFPQCLAFLSLLAPFLSVWWLLCLLFLLPIPSPTRAWLEFRGYSMTMACKWWLTGNEINYYWIERQFVGQWYYFMWPFKGIVRKMFEKQMEKIKNDDLSPEQRKVKEIADRIFLEKFREKIDDNGEFATQVNQLQAIINDMLIENKQNGLTLDRSSHILLNNVDTLNKNSNASKWRRTSSMLRPTAYKP